MPRSITCAILNFLPSLDLKVYGEEINHANKLFEIYCKKYSKLFRYKSFIKNNLKLTEIKPHCVKTVQIRSIFWSVFSRIRTKYGEIRSISPYSVRMRENTDQKILRIWTLFTQCLVFALQIRKKKQWTSPNAFITPFSRFASIIQKSSKVQQQTFSNSFLKQNKICYKVLNLFKQQISFYIHQK